MKLEALRELATNFERISSEALKEFRVSEIPVGGMLEVILDYNLYPDKVCLVNQDLEIVAKLKTSKGKIGVGYGWLVRNSKNEFVLYHAADSVLKVRYTVVGMRYGDYADKYKSLHGVHVHKLLSMGTEKNQVEFKPQPENESDSLAVVLEDNLGEIFGWMAKTCPGAGNTTRHRTWIHKGIIRAIVTTIDMDPVQKRGQESVKVFCEVQPTHFMDGFSYLSSKMSEKLRKESFPVEADSSSYYNSVMRTLDETENTKRKEMFRSMLDPNYSRSKQISDDAFANFRKPWES